MSTSPPPASTSAPLLASPPSVLSLASAEPPATELVVFLHGVGADARSFHDVARALAPALPHAELVTPDGFHPFDQGPGRQWFSVRGVTEQNRAARVREAAGEVSAWLDRELDARGLGRQRLVVVGFSQGSIVGAWLAVHRSPPPLAVVLFSGRVADDAPPVAGTTTSAVFMAHGTSDAVIPYAALEPGAKTLEAWGARVTKRTYPIGHEIDAAELRDARDFLMSALAVK